MAEGEIKVKSGDEETFLLIARNFANTTTAHGFSHVVASRHSLVKLLWIICIVACQVGLYLQVRPLVENYMKKPIKTKIILQEERQQVFPVITICNTNIIRSSTLKDLLEYNYFLQQDKYPEAATKKKRKRRATRREKRQENQTTDASTTTEEGGQSSGSEEGQSLAAAASQIPTLGSSTLTLPYFRTNATNNTKQQPAWKPDDDDSGFRVKDEDAQDYRNKQNILEGLANVAHHYSEEVLMYGHQFYDMFLKCKWKDYYDCLSDVWWKPVWHWRYGNCYSFNSGANESVRLQRVSGTGPYNGLSIMLALNQSEYVQEFMTDTAGIVLHIGEQGARVEPYLNGHKLGPNLAHDIEITKKKIHRVDPFQNKSCIKHQRVDLGRRSFSQPTITKYSLQACKDICEASEQLARCGCTSYWLPAMTSNRTCGEEDLYCTDDIREKRINGSLRCLTKCRLPCDEVKYLLQTSSTDYPTKKIRLQDPNYYAKYVKDEVLKVSISFNTLETEVIHNEQYYFIENLLGDIGGQLGLWSGVSSLTVLELLFFFWQGLYLLFKWCGYKAAKNGQKVGNKMNTKHT